MAESGNFDQILPYSREVGYNPDFNGLLQNIGKATHDCMIDEIEMETDWNFYYSTSQS